MELSELLVARGGGGAKRELPILPQERTQRHSQSPQIVSF